MLECPTWVCSCVDKSAGYVVFKLPSVFQVRVSTTTTTPSRLTTQPASWAWSSTPPPGSLTSCFGWGWSLTASRPRRRWSRLARKGLEMAVPEEWRFAVPALLSVWLAGCVRATPCLWWIYLWVKLFFFVSDQLGWISSPGIDSATAFFVFLSFLISCLMSRFKTIKCKNVIYYLILQLSGREIWF